MFKTFTSLEELLAEVHIDRQLEGDGAGTANRFPVRFVLFDNFRDCCDFVEDVSHLPHIAIQRIEDWMDDEYPDVFMPHAKLLVEECLKLKIVDINLICQHIPIMNLFFLKGNAINIQL